METIQYRYPGPKAFTEDQSQLFKGREKEIRYLANLIDLKKTVVLFGKSGTGKSSLLNAGVMPMVKKIQNYEARVIRLLFKGDVSLNMEEDSNYLVNNVIQNYPSDTDHTFLKKIPFEGNSLWWHFKQLQILDKNLKCYLLIFDQFEELGSYQHKMVSKFLKQLNELLNFPISPEFKAAFQEAQRNNPELITKEEVSLLFEPIAVKLVLIVKSEKLGLLHAVKNYISDILQNCHELNPLSKEQAIIAIEKPASEDLPHFTPPFKFERDAINSIVDYLQEKSDTTFYESPGIQTSLLQMICSQIEQVIVPNDEDKVITSKELKEINELTEDYYNSKIKLLVNLFNLDEVKEKLIRKFLEDKLITQQGETLFREQIFEDNFPIEYTPLKEYDNRILEQLVAFGILRKDKRLAEKGIRYFYEISHEKLLDPILNHRNKQIQQQKDNTNTKKDEQVAVNRRHEHTVFSVSESSITPENNLKSNDAYEYLKIANEFSYAGDCANAIKNYSHSINIDPNYFTFYLRGSEYYKDKKYEDAIKDFETTLKKNPDYFDAYNEIGRCYLQLKNYDEASEHFKKVIEKNGKAHYAYNNLGLTLLNQNKLEEAIDQFNEALKIDPRFASSYQNRAIALGLLKRFDESIADFNTLEELEPGTYTPFYSRGICYNVMATSATDSEQARQYFEKSIIELTQSLVLQPSDSLAKYYLALDYENCSNFTQALQYYTELIKSDPNYADAWYRKGICENELKLNKEAVHSFTKLTELDPNYYSAFFERGRIQYTMANYAEAILDFTEVLRKNKDYKEAYYNRGLSYYYSQEYAQAIEDFDASITIDQKDYLSYFKRGQAKYSLHQYQLAINDLNVMAAHDASYPKLNVYIGACYSGLGDYDKALDYHLKEYDIKPDYFWNLQNLGFCYQEIIPPDYSKALYYHLEANKLEAKNPWNLSNIGFCYQSIEPADYKTALEFHLAAHELNATDVWNLANISTCYRKLDPPDYLKSLEFITKAFELNPKDALVETNLGWTQLILGKKEIAREHFENALKQDPTLYECYMNLGHIAMLENDGEKAKHLYAKRLQGSENKEQFKKECMKDSPYLVPLGLNMKYFEEVVDQMILAK